MAKTDQTFPSAVWSLCFLAELQHVTVFFFAGLNIEQTQTSGDAKMKNLFPFALPFAKQTPSDSTFYTFRENEITLNVLATSVTKHSSVYGLNALGKNGFDSIFNETQL